MIYTRLIGVAAAAAALVLSAAPSFAALQTCSKQIDTQSLAMQSSILKFFQQCNDAYRKDALKPPTPPFSKAAAKCETLLSAKVLGAGTGAIDKGVNKLVKLVPKTCTDADLIALGHLPTNTFGTRWAQFQGVAALQYAYEQQLIATRDWVNMLAIMGRTGSCPTCVKFNKAPCQETSCRLTGSTATVNLNGTSFDVTVEGATVLKFCDVSQLISSATGVVFVLGTPGKVLKPAPVSNISTACVKQLAAEGLVQCGVGAQKISYTQCQDHNPSAPNAAGVPASGACSGDVCLQTQTNAQSDIVDPAETNDQLHGGVCLTLTATGGDAGDAFVNLSSQIGLDQPGGDCTDETKFQTVGTPQISPLTTGNATATVKNADFPDAPAGTEIVSDPATGAKYVCGQLAAGQTPSVKLVGAFPALNTLPVGNQLLDSVTGFALQCEP